MDKILIAFCLIVGASASILVFPDGIVASALALIISGAVILIIRSRTGTDADYLVWLFIIALLARIVFGLTIHVFQLREFFGGDAITYDSLGYRIVELWFGQASPDDFWSQRATSLSNPGWGMNYLTGFIYLLVGRNILAAQTFCGVIGAATVPLVYICAYRIFNNRRVGKISALLVALYPAFIIWSGQLMKDGLIIFLLVLAMTMVLRLQEKIDYVAIGILIFSLFGILSLRFYIFYMAAAAAIGAFIIGHGKTSPQAIFRRLAVLVLLGIGLTYLGVLRNASAELDKYGSLENIQRSRQNLAEAADSGFGDDLDVSTTEGALAALPIGITYLMLAPFPWQISNLRQAITLPEILLWWSSIPLIIIGIVYTVRNRLRPAIPILIFTIMLTLAYSIFQGNVGTVYRQRTQIQVFLFIFIGVGWTVIQERKENEMALRKLRNRQLRNVTSRR
jgi:4-amino-4-deoxy-L-arabinose transferase and related glycosyltransferases of PMT family